MLGKRLVGCRLVGCLPVEAAVQVVPAVASQLACMLQAALFPVPQLVRAVRTVPSADVVQVPGAMKPFAGPVPSAGTTQLFCASLNTSPAIKVK